jgi:lactoylglutathione lyase
MTAFSLRILLGFLAVTMVTPTLVRAADPPAATALTDPAVFANTVIWVPDVKRAADFYTKAFGIKVTFAMDLGTHWWLEMSTGVTRLSFASEKQAVEFMKGKVHKNRRTDTTAAIALTLKVKNLQAALKRAIDAGAILVQPPITQPWGLVEARVRDPDGVLVDIVAPAPAKK